MAARETKRGGETPGAGAAVITRTRTQTKRPNMYRVLLLNDDYTPMEFRSDGRARNQERGRNAGRRRGGHHAHPDADQAAEHVSRAVAERRLHADGIQI